MTSVAIAAPHGDAVTAAEAAVEAGGNALDAALAAATVLAVTYPHQCSVGGDLTALVRRTDGEVLVLLSIGAAARATDPDALRGTEAAMPRQGPLTVTVPGVMAGWTALAELGARLGLARPLREAAAIAAAGSRVSPGLARAIATRLEAVLADPGLHELFAPGDRPLEAGDELLQPALARTLEELADDPGCFYRGVVSTRLARGLAALGSPLSTDDLAAHAPERRAPLSIEAGGARWWAPPPPSQGATALALIDDRDPRDLLRRARSAQSARDRLLGDPRGGPVDVDGMLHPDAPGAAAATGQRAGGDTVAISALDSDGLAVVLVQSVFQTFGSGLLEPATGIVLHNRGAAFSLSPDGPGRLAPGLRPPHTLCPLLAQAPGILVAAGCQGGRAQPLILAQLAARLCDPEAAAADTLAAPRWVLGSRDLEFESETVLHEPGAELPPAGGIPAVEATGPDDRCGHVQVARAVGDRLEAASDPRADGRGVVVEGG